MKCFRKLRNIFRAPSPSMRREWIEMSSVGVSTGFSSPSPSMRREWIEIILRRIRCRNCRCLPPCGGSGLKFQHGKRGENCDGLPPCGGSGLKSNCGSFCEISLRLPPCGGSGLKWNTTKETGVPNESPSMRREWIEISIRFSGFVYQLVSLHAEGVD